MIRCIHIAPELPPAVGGIADYTAILSRRLDEVSGGAVETVLVHAGWQSPSSIDANFPVVDLSGKCSASVLGDAIKQLAGESEDQAVVLLEYSGYGYAKRGAPLWLFRGLRRVCESDGIPLVTMFHELYATGPPWTTAFWLSFAQAWVARRLAGMSRAVVTNRAKSARWLQNSVSSGCPVRVQPTFSNVGEPGALPSFQERAAHAVVFGGRAMKDRLYSSLQKKHVQQLREVGVSRVLEIGASDSTSPDTLYGLPVERHGVQPAQTISSVLREARVGLLHYPVDYLTKSGIWASYAAHGVPPLILSDSASTVEVENRIPYLRFRDNRPGKKLYLSQLRSVGENVWKWYQETAMSKIAARKTVNFLRQLGKDQRVNEHE